MSGMDNPPSTTGSPRALRRALVTGLALVLTIGVPVGLNALGGGPGIASASTPTAPVVTRPADDLARVEALAQAASTPRPEPTTTTAPPAPTTTTTVAPPPPPAPPAPEPVAAAPATSGTGWNDPANPAAWDRLAQCESGGNWAADTGNGYYGGIQFSLASWHGVGGTGYPNQNSRETQIAMGQRLWRQGGWSHWPACSSQLGYR